MSRTVRRVAIVGAGCAGLLAAVELRRRRRDLSVVLFEPRTRFVRDRTWCWWRMEPHETDELADHRWEAWRVRGDGRDVVIRRPEQPYCHLPADRLYAWALDRLDAPGVELHTGATIESVRDGTASARVEGRKDDGGTIEDDFDLVLDGRPPRAMRPGEGLVQHFIGHEVELDRDGFDPGVATLMDFDVDQSRGLHFMYVLPFGPRHGLVESTFMTPSPADAAPDEGAHVARWIDRHLGGAAARIVRTERGRLPMTTARLGPASSQRAWTIGTAAGIARASTGYAFDAIRRDSVRVAEAVVAGTPRPRPPRSGVLERLDRWFVSLLGARPELGPRIFASLFERVEPGALLRFLNDRPEPRDLAAVVRAVPALPMVGHLLASPGALLGRDRP